MTLPLFSSIGIQYNSLCGCQIHVPWNSTPTYLGPGSLSFTNRSLLIHHTKSDPESSAGGLAWPASQHGSCRVLTTINHSAYSLILIVLLHR